jgi:Tfp pilus assembly protein PilF
MSRTSQLEAMLAAGTDTATLRFALASGHAADGDTARALEHAAVAVERDPDYSAAWRLLGKLQTEAGLLEDAMHSYKRGIEAAAKRGDRQAEKEMTVFLKRLERR